MIFGLPERDIAKLQKVQNTAARLVVKSRRCEHITPILHGLHWLPVQQRVVYKILLFVYKALHGLAPQFIADLVHLYIPARALRSASERRLVPIMASTKYYGERAFSSAASKLWNQLPRTVRESPSVETFKSRLKTHLFVTYYN